MNKPVQTALTAALDAFAKQSGQDTSAFQKALFEVFDLDAKFMDKLKAFDKVFNDHPAVGELQEVFFDMLMVNFFTSDAAKLEADYLDSPEWLAIEEDTLDRGTELLNLLLYINECKDENIQPSLDDFLKEFLLVEEDEFQDEFHIYEDLISNQQLPESSIEDICNTARLMDLHEEMEQLFVPFMAFFYQPDVDAEVVKELSTHSSDPDFDVAVYTLITNFNKL